MKKILIYILIMGFMISCGGEVGSTSGNKDKSGNSSTSGGGNNSDEDNPCDNKPLGDNGETPPALPC